MRHMEELKDRRLQEEMQHARVQHLTTFVHVHRSWHAEQPNKSALPRAIDLMFRPEVREIVDQPINAREAEEAFVALSHSFPQWVNEWKTECAEKLRALVRDSPAFEDKIPDGVDPLTLASVAFTCNNCKHDSCSYGQERLPPLYPAILTHECLWKRVWDFQVKEPYERAAVTVSKTKCTFSTHTSWSCDVLEVGVWHRRASEVIQAFRKDPLTATREEMDGINDIRLYCGRCARLHPYKREVMTWRDAVSTIRNYSSSVLTKHSHQLLHYAYHDVDNNLHSATDYGPAIKHPVIWHTMPIESVSKIRDLEDCAQKQYNNAYKFFLPGNWYYCCHCARGGLSQSALFDHLKWS